MPTAKAQPAALERLITKLTSDIQATTNDLADGTTDVDVWRDQMAQALTTFHGAAYLAGARQTTLDELARKRIAGDVRVQLQYLDNFALEIQNADEFEQGWQARAESYADSIKIPYWAGRTKVLPLPSDARRRHAVSDPLQMSLERRHTGRRRRRLRRDLDPECVGLLSNMYSTSIGMEPTTNTRRRAAIRSHYG
jgi:hypothetical protein